MTVSVSTPETSYVLSGVGLGPFATGWRYELSGEVHVYLVTDGVALLLSGDNFTVSGATPLLDGGAVTLSEAMLPAGGAFDPDTHALVLRRATPLTQAVAFGDFQSFRPATTEAAFDRLTRMLQDQRRDLDKALLVPAGSAESRASKLVGFDDDGNVALYEPGEGGAGVGGVNSVNDKTGVVTLDKADIGLALAENKSSATIRAELTSGNVTTALGFTPENAANRGNANGYAPLGADGKVSPAYLSASGAQIYKGGWNATTNSPAIPAAVPANNGWYYIVTTAGTTTIDGLSTWAVGDWIISNGAAWDRVVNADAVVSVAGLLGDISAGSLRTALDLASLYLAKAGGTLTGELLARNINPAADATYSLGNHDPLKRWLDVATYRLSLYSADGTFLKLAGGGVTGSDKTLTLATDNANRSLLVDQDVTVSNLATKAYVDTPKSGTHTVTRSGGTLDLTGYNDKTVKILDGVSGDFNVWKVILPEGQRVFAYPAANMAFLFDSGLTGANIVGHYEGVERHQDNNRMGTMTVRPKDMMLLVGEADGNVRVMRLVDSYMSRVGWQAPGDSRNPEEAYMAFGMVGLWSDIKGTPYGTLLLPQNDTIRKITVGGANFVGVGDSSILSFENYASEGQDEGVGLDTPGYAVPWTDYKRIGNRIRWVAKIANGTGKLIGCDAVIAAGAPGSLNQGEYATVQGYASALPTSSSTPGGLVLQSTPAGINCPIDRLVVSSTGAIVVVGQAAFEAYGTFGAATTGGRLTDDNLDQWHAPGLFVKREGPHYGDLQFYASNGGAGRFYAVWSARDHNDHVRGVDFLRRSDEDTYWLMGCDATLGRTRVWGVSPGDPATFIWGDGLKSRGSYREIADDQFYRWTLGASKSGRMQITLNDHNYTLDIGFSTDTGGILTVFATASAAALFVLATGTASAGSGTDGKITVYCDGTGISISNRSGGAKNFRVKFDYA